MKRALVYRMMKARVLIAIAVAFGAPAWADTPAQAFGQLTGWCWRADIGDGATDTHCFTAATGGNLVMDVHKVRNRSGEVVYEGVTAYRLEKGSGAIRYEYFNSLGDLLPGYGRREGDKLLFSPAPNGAPDVVWYLGSDAYEVGSAAVTSAKTKFVRGAAAGTDGL